MESCRLDVDQFPHAADNASLDGRIVDWREVASNLLRSDCLALSNVVVWRCDAAVPWNKCFQLSFLKLPAMAVPELE